MGLHAHLKSLHSTIRPAGTHLHYAACPNTTDWIILALSVAGLCLVYLLTWQEVAPADHISIMAGEHRQQVPLDHDQVLEIHGVLGISRIEIRNRRVRFLSSPCANQLCTHQGWVSAASELIACLPNRVVLTLDADRSDFDAINY